MTSFMCGALNIGGLAMLSPPCPMFALKKFIHWTYILFEKMEDSDVEISFYEF